MNTLRFALGLICGVVLMWVTTQDPVAPPEPIDNTINTLSTNQEYTI